MTDYRKGDRLLYEIPEREKSARHPGGEVEVIALYNGTSTLEVRYVNVERYNPPFHLSIDNQYLKRIESPMQIEVEVITRTTETVTLGPTIVRMIEKANELFPVITSQEWVGIAKFIHAYINDERVSLDKVRTLIHEERNK